MNATPHADPRQLADPRRFAEMQAALSSAEMFGKKAAEWDKAHGLGYHLVTALMILSGCFPLMLFAIDRFNPYRGLARSSSIEYRKTHDEIAKANGLPTFNENIWGMKAQRPAPKARRPAPQRAILAA